MDPDLRVILGRLLDPVLERRCGGCRGTGYVLCAGCRTLLQSPPGRVVPDPAPPSFPFTVAAAPYEGPVREALVAFKDHDRWALGAPLGDALARSVAHLVTSTLTDGDPGPASAVGPVTLVPVPGSPGSARARDGDHVRELARRAARQLRRTGLDVDVVAAVVAVRPRRDQVGLDRRQRAANLTGSTAATTRAPAIRAAVVVDDLLTTGATVVEVTRALRTARVPVLGAAVVAATSRSWGTWSHGLPGA